jgi:hypothetical protein
MMTIHPEYVVDDANQRKSVVLSLSEWEQIMEELEELEDIRAYDHAKAQPSEPVPFEDAVREVESGEQG